jgi:hypothetical protein
MFAVLLSPVIIALPVALPPIETERFCLPLFSLLILLSLLDFTGFVAYTVRLRRRLILIAGVKDSGIPCKSIEVQPI